MRTLLLFGSGTVILGYLSRAALRAPHSHGFYRFFAWEAMLGLLLMQAEYWFDQPWSLHQSLAWLLLSASLMLVVSGFYCLRRYGGTDPQRNDGALLGVERTTRLITAGPFRYIRHPLYSSLLWLTWGMFWKHPSPLSGLVAMVATIFLIITAKVEETENVRFFGSDYHAYMAQTRMFVPFLF